MLSMVTGVSDGIGIGVPGFSLSHRGEKALTMAIRFARSCTVRGLQEGMLVVKKPRVMLLKRSSSVGIVPVGVERHLNTARVKSRGLGSIHCAFSPAPSPFGP